MRTSSVIELFERSTSTLHFDDDDSFAANDLVADGRRLAAWLLAAGRVPGDRIALHLGNGVDYVRLLLACAAGGFVGVSVNTRYSAIEVDDLVARANAHRVATADAWRTTEPSPQAVAADAPYLVFTTSGTTSRPKMVVHAQRSIAEHAFDAAAGFGYTGDDVVLVAMPLCGTFGLTSLMAAVAGDCTVFVTDFEVARSTGLIETHGVTAVNGSDDMFHRLIGHGADLSSIRIAGYARFNTSLHDIVGEAERVGATLTGLYGMSEVQALFSVRDPSLDVRDRMRPGGTVVSPAAAYRVVDDELQVRGPSLMLGYLAEGGRELDEVLTAEHFDDGWFRTGDLASPDDDRTFEYLTRRGDAMRLGGFLVNPGEIEAVISSLPTIHDAQVVAVDLPGGARPVAFVIGAFDEASVIATCREQLAVYKVPVRVVGIEEFPVTASANGTKVQRAKLRERAASMLSTAP